MDSQFSCNPNSNGSGEEFSAILHIHVHHARNIHNICIYDNQDVYAKFSLTYNPDETISTRIVNGGGKNPEFNDHLIMPINHIDAVLKCEIWMMSRARNLLEDQLLGFALVPLSPIISNGKITQCFSLSSTDLFHSPAGTVKLSLSLNPSLGSNQPNPATNSSITSEVVLLDRTISVSHSDSELILDPLEYSSIEFPDISVVQENQQMVSEYFENHWSLGNANFLHLGSAISPNIPDYEMNPNSSEEGIFRSAESVQNSTTTTSFSDDRNSADSIAKKVHPLSGLETSSSISNQDAKNANDGAVFPFNINVDAEQSALQKHIVEMYMRSMQQFTESLAKMKLPMEMERSKSMEECAQDSDTSLETEKKDGSRVFYGSRAFF